MMNLLEKLPKFVLVILAGLSIIAITYYGWQFKRWVNYSWSYESQVTKSICDMVKPQYLKDSKRCL